MNLMRRKYMYAVMLLVMLAGNILSLHGQNKRYNYVHSKMMLDKEGKDYLETTKYYDSFGVLKETNRHGCTPDGLDLVTREDRTIYNSEQKVWLPIAVDGNGNFVHDFKFESEARKFYGDAAPYTNIEYDTYSSGRVRKQYGAGELWSEKGKCISTNYLTNTESGDLICYHYAIQDKGGDDFVLQQNGTYSNATLEVKETIDEDGNKSYEFTDYQGRLLLTRQMEGNTPHDTYYLYTLSGKIQAVIPPVLADITVSNGMFNMSILRDYAYLYRYDHRDRLVEKWIPGSATSFRYIYDKADRLVLAQDANQRAMNQWKLTKYDIHGRNILVGILTTSESFETLTKNLGNQTLTETYTGNQTEDSYGYTQTFISGDIAMLSVVYYDDYRFLDLDRAFIRYVKGVSSGNYYQTPKGQLTGEIIFALGDVNRKQYVTHYYNNRNWEIQNNRYDSAGFTDKNYTQYDFVGNRLQMRHIHTGINNTSIEELYIYVYDHANRLLQVKHKLNNSPEIILTANEYDEVCRLKRTTMNNGKIASEYDYNIRNWLTKISNPLFTQTLHYTDGLGIPYYGGNISSMTWKVGNATEQGYRYTYDGMSRLKDAIYGEGSSLSSNSNRFNEQVMSYDKMGNILGLKRNGQTNMNEFGLVDNLILTYNGNQLKSVNDNAVSSAYQDGFDFKDGIKQSTEYYYDLNGNLIKDLNKKISDIQYNCLNLPQIITFLDGSTIFYVYSSMGTKLRMVHTIRGINTIIDYYGSAIYENGILVKLLTEVGYITLNDYEYHYFVQDHQGNNRIVVDQNGTIEETNHYYPFGGLISSLISNVVQPYKYNGKELDRRNELNWYDYGARMYDVALGRWHVIDPLIENHYENSPYSYCNNEPVNRVDPDGNDWFRKKDADDDWMYIWRIDDQEMEEEEYLGKTYTDKNTYYSLLGSQYSIKSKEGKTMQKIDQALINNFMASPVYDNYQNLISGAEKETDFDIGEYPRKSSLNLLEDTYFTFEAEGGNVTYFKVNKGVENKAIFGGFGYVQKGTIRGQGNRGTGNLKSGIPIYFERKRANGNVNSAQIVFPTEQSAIAFYEKCMRLFMKK